MYFIFYLCQLTFLFLSAPTQRRKNTANEDQQFGTAAFGAISKDIDAILLAVQGVKQRQENWEQRALMLEESQDRVNQADTKFKVRLSENFMGHYSLSLKPCHSHLGLTA